MSVFVGADTESLRELSAAMRSAADRLSRLCESLNGSLRRSAWVGVVADDARSAWFSHHAPALVDAAALLSDISGRLIEQAVQQETASEAASFGRRAPDVEGIPAWATPVSSDSGAPEPTPARSDRSNFAMWEWGGEVPELGLWRVDLPLFNNSTSEAIHYLDVRQGGMTDCYLLASLAALASTEAGRAFIRGMVRHEGDHFIVTFADGHTERVDREFWANGSGTNLAYAKPGDDIWVMVVEEAYAKYRGGEWDDVRGGWHFERAFTDLGLATHRVTASELTPSAWEGMLTGHNAVTLADDDGWHAFAVVDVMPGQGAEEDKVRIYNPWHTWDTSDGPLRFPEVPGLVYNTDGTVVMTVSQAQKIFEYASWTDVGSSW